MTTLDERLAAIRAREQAATEGPWSHANRYRADVRTINNVYVIADVRGLNWQCDATFIAHARTDVPALLAAVDAVLAEHKRIALTGGAVVCSRCASWVEEDPVSHDWPCPTVRAVTEALGATE